MRKAALTAAFALVAAVAVVAATAHADTAAGGDAKARAVILQVPRGGIEHLPDALNIRLSAGQFRRGVWRHVRRRLRVRH